MDDDAGKPRFASTDLALIGLSACVIAVCASGLVAALAIGTAAFLISMAVSETPCGRIARECFEPNPTRLQEAAGEALSPDIESGQRWQQTIATSRLTVRSR